MKRIISIFLILTMLLLTCSCSANKPEDTDSADITENAEIKTTVTAEVYYPFDIGSTVSYAARINNTLFMAGENIVGLMQYEITGNGEVGFSETKLLEITLDEGQTVLSLCAGGDGNFYVLAGENPRQYYDSNRELIIRDDYSGSYNVFKYSANGEALDILKITNWHGDSANGIAVGEGGEIVIYDGLYYSLLDWDKEVIFTNENPDDILLSVSCCDKGLVASYSQLGFCLIDEKTGKLSQLDFDISQDAIDLVYGNNCITQGLDGEFIVSTGSGYLSVDFNSGASKKLLSLPEELFSKAEECQNVCRLSKSTFLIAINNIDGLYIVREVEIDSSEKSVVKVAVYGQDISLSGKLNKLSSNSDYIYEAVYYSPSDFARLNVELTTTGAPDLVLFSYDEYWGGGNYLNTDSDFFDDLYTYIDADPEFSRDSFLPNLLEAMSFNGKLGQLWPYAEICTVAARLSDVKDIKNPTITDYNEMVKNSEAYKTVSVMSKSNFLSDISVLAASIYTNKKNASCSFNDKSFSELLAWCNNMGEDIEVIEGDPNAFRYENSEVLLSFETVGMLMRVSSIREYGFDGEPYIFVGYPIGEGAASYYKSSGICMAIPAFSSNKEGAWNYIRTELSIDVQLQPNAQSFRNITFYSMPSTYEALRRLAANSLNDEEYDLVIDLVNNTTYAQNYTDAGLQEIIISAGTEYLGGSKTLEETVELIQSRASIYMSEKYG